MTDELDDLRDKAARATQIEQAVAQVVRQRASPNDARILLKLSVTDQLDWLRYRTAPPAPPPPPPVDDTDERAKAEMRKRYRQILG